ncbi:disease resistance protein RPM1 [Cryptomeria japonica]|uniref:disease resistance protein RPM1 n=1 Tax=Cryptomeria japonica TaxID=3369 RepID=UPI0027DA12B6|nr:disease resistance protein RPM1 [Cryptomeria japonica]
MADAISQAVIGKLTEMIVQHAAGEAALVRNFNRDFQWLKKRLRTISGGLKYTDKLPTREDDIKEWLQNVRDVAWDAEDIVEECAVRPLYTRSATQSCICSPDELLFRYKMGKRIQEVKEAIDSITKDGKQLKLFRDLVPSGFEPPSSSSAWEARKGNRILPSYPVAIEPKIQHLISIIDESTVPVIAVVGMGGAGKTFLLQHLFDRIKERYELSIWLSISQSYSVQQLQCDLVSHMDLEVDDVSEDRAAELINADLQGKKYLIVLDDVWTSARGGNIIRNLGLSIGHESQCKLLVTTRNRDVCQNLGAKIYEMELLSEEESWQLFCFHAFPDYNQNLPPPYLEKVARHVEKQCDGLPLALKTIGASLSGCTDTRKWSSKLSQLKELELSQQKEVADPDYRIIEILRLSYDSLPSALKPCFSCLSFFHEDEIIDCEYLINLWIMEGFIIQRKDQWDIALGYLYQLANLCLLDVWEEWGLIKYCKIHDFLFDLAIGISKENRCAFAVEDDFTAVKRILLPKKAIDDVVTDPKKSSCPRSLRTLSLHNNPLTKIEANFLSPIRLLRVLDLSETKISSLPYCLGKLKLLKLLNLSSTKVEEVPICVRSLKSLVFLDLNLCRQLRRLPEWIGELKCLRHLNVKYCKDELRNHVPKGISELLSLRVLRSDDLRLSVEDDGLLKLDDAVKLTHLQELSLQLKHENELKSIEDGILRQLVEIRHLSIASRLSTESHLPENITALQDLETLNVKKFVVPSWVSILINLRQLILFYCICSDYPALETMPNLVELKIYGNTNCRELPKAFVKSSGFPKLRFLLIEDFPLLEELPDLEDGAMAVLEKFRLRECPKLKKVPEGLERLRRLKEFNYFDSGTDEFRETLSEGGQVRKKIKAKNPHVYFMR